MINWSRGMSSWVPSDLPRVALTVEQNLWKEIATTEL